jgi:hypothetical protein
MTDKNDKSDAETAELVDSLVVPVVDSFVEELVGIAEGLGGTIDCEQIRNVAESFKDDAKSNSVLKECVKRLAAHQKSVGAESNREQALERILVHRIEGVFPTKGDLGQGRQILSRRALPGLFEAIKLSIGTDQFDTRAKVCAQALASHRAEAKGDTDWSVMYKNQECNNAVDEVLSIFATNLERLDDHVKWMSDQINQRLAPPAEFAHEGDAVNTWRMDNIAAQMILRGLFARFFMKIAEPDGRDSLASQFGDAEITAVEGLLKSLRGSA